MSEGNEERCQRERKNKEGVVCSSPDVWHRLRPPHQGSSGRLLRAAISYETLLAPELTGASTSCGIWACSVCP